MTLAVFKNPVIFVYRHYRETYEIYKDDGLTGYIAILINFLYLTLVTLGGTALVIIYYLISIGKGKLADPYKIDIISRES